jgi:starvation-inducible DNA-binding protein
LLDQHLVNTLDLSILVHRAYWGSVGQSQKLHALFHKISGEWLTLVGKSAEAIRGLGGQPLATARFLVDHSGLPDYPQGATAVRDRIQALHSIYLQYEQVTRASLRIAQALNCKTAVELIQEAKSRAERDLCSLEACLIRSQSVPW